MIKVNMFNENSLHVIYINKKTQNEKFYSLVVRSTKSIFQQLV